MGEFNGLYSLAPYYDIVFRRDVSPEIRFLKDLFRTCRGRSPASVIELACGPGYHARHFARCGLRATGLDIRSEMIQFAAEEARRDNVDVEWVVGDMRDFPLSRPVDLALCLFWALESVLTEDDLVRHFRTVASHLTSDGLYVIEHGHPRELLQEEYGDYRYYGERDGCSVRIDWATNHPQAPDPGTEIWSVDVTVTIREHGTERVTVDRARERFWLPEEIVEQANRSGALRVREWYGDFRVDQPLDETPSSCRMVAVLEKTAAG